MTPIETIVRHVLDRAAETIKANEVLHGSGADELQARSDGNLSGLAYATAILALPIDQIAADVEAMLPDAAKVAALVRAAKAEIDVRNAYEDTPVDRGGSHGPKGQAYSNWLKARADVLVALANLETKP